MCTRLIHPFIHDIRNYNSLSFKYDYNNLPGATPLTIYKYKVQVDGTFNVL